MTHSDKLEKASAEPRAILQAISERHGWTISHTVNVTAERMGVSRSTLWEWKWGKKSPLPQNKLALYYCQFEPGTEVEIRGEDPEARMHARAVFQAGLKPKMLPAEEDEEE
ncbi:MAG: helix-turn-helix domain-containing protein [Akkermansiaceae bacterium]|nr:helix-turn-helix domain-containing protein [Akkermansiaceae bacterium]